MSIKPSFLIAASVAVLPLLAEAKPLYVNNSGSPACSDATTYAANDSARPWCSIGRAAWGSTNPNAPVAAQAAQAGDTVNISSGTYSTSSTRTACGNGARYAVALNPVNSGTAGAPIRFVGVGTVNVLLASGYAGPTIGADGRNYIAWDNVRIDETVAPGLSCADTGPVVIHSSTGSMILNSNIRGTYRGWSDNYCGVRLEATNGAVISNNAIYGFTGNWSHNDAAIMTYDAANSIIEYNYIHSSQTGIFIKGDHAGDGWPQDNNVIRFNWMENNSNKSVFVYTGNNTRIYQNVIKQSQGYAFRHDSSNGSGTVFANNTVISTSATGALGYSGSSVSPTVTGFRIFNNIFYGTFDEAVNLGDAAGFGGQAFEHNVYFGFRNFGSLNGSLISFATWKNTHNRDNASPAGINANPTFVDTTLYKLQAGSPARTVGVDILDLDGNGSTTNIVPAGAYVTGAEVIGPAAGRSPPAAPPPAPPPAAVLPAPTNLR